MSDDRLLLSRRGQAGGEESGILTPDGIFVRADGRPWWGVGVTAFPMTERWAFNRPAVYAFADWMVSHKAGIARVLSMTHKGDCLGVGNFGPQDVGGEDAFVAICVELTDYLASRGRRIDLQVFADMQTDDCKPNNPLSQIDQPRLYGKVNAALAGKWNVILGYGNQAAKNGFDPYALPLPHGVFGTRGSGLEDELPFLPPYQAAEFHPGRNLDFARKYKSVYEMRIGETGEANGFQKVPGPIFFTEPIRIGEHTNGSACSDPHLMWDFAAGCKGWGVAALYGHLETGRDLLLPGPRATATFDAMVDAWTRIPADFALGSYARGDGHGGNRDLSVYHHDTHIDGQYFPDGALRTYELTIGNESLVIVTDPGPTWTLRIQHGAVVESWGYGHGRPDTVFRMRR